MEAYKIYIDSEGVIKAILLPEEPNEHTFKEMFLNNMNYLNAVKEYNETVSKAKQEAIPFKDQGDLHFILAKHYLQKITQNNVLDTIFDLPEGYSVELVPSDVITIKRNNVESRNMSDLSGHFHEVLKKIENSAHGYTEGADVPVNTEDEKGVDQKEELRKRFEKFHTENDFPGYNDVFDFFYSEIESVREERWDSIYISEKKKWEEELTRLRSEIQKRDIDVEIKDKMNTQLREELASIRKAMEAADEVIELQEKYIDSFEGHDYTSDGEICDKKDSALEKYETLKKEKT